MGEMTRVDPLSVRALADGMAAIGAEVARMRWPALDAGALPGSAVGAVASADLVGDQLLGVGARLDAWVAAAHAAADAFAAVDAASGDRVARK